MPRLLVTPGVKELADDHGAYWLIDAIASHQTAKLDQQCDGFQLWELTVQDDASATLTCRRDKNEPAAVEQAIPFTDYPRKHLKLYVCDNVLMLPEEY